MSLFPTVSRTKDEAADVVVLTPATHRQNAPAPSS